MSYDMSSARREGFDPDRLCATEQQLLERLKREGVLNWIDMPHEHVKYLDRLALRGLVKAEALRWTPLT